MKIQLKKLKKYIVKLDNKLIRTFLKNRFLSNVYYFFNSSFWREEKAVLQGRYQYYLNSKNSGQNLFFLRRSIHRLEKGILMRPRRDVFAESYIEDTVDTYINLKTEGNQSSTIRWANNVLNNFFEITNSTKSPRIKAAKNAFLESGNITKKKDLMVPYKRNKENKPKVDIEDFEKLAIYRRSVRWFLNRKVDHNIIDKAIEVAGYSPSACNRIPYKFRVFDEKDKVKKIAKTAMGTTGYIDNIPTIIALVGDLSAYPKERDRHLIYVDSSLAAMSFVYSLEIQGIGSCIINWPDIEKREKQIGRLLNLEPYERVTMLIAIGYEDPEGMVAYSNKKDLNEMRTYNI